MSKAGKFFTGFLVVILILIGAVAAFVATFDIDKYRDQIAGALSEQTGRTVKFGGPIKLAVNSHGIGVAAENASIGNPQWASRPEMASIGKLQLGVGLMPLLDHKVVITDLDVSNADIQLETNASNEHNWEMKPATVSQAAPAKQQPAAQQGASGKPAIGVSVEELSIVDSKVAMRDKDGKTSTLKVSKLTLSPESRGIAVSLNADYNGQPIKLALKTGASDLMAEAKWPYDADLTYANYHVNAQGNVDMGAKTIDLNPYDVTSGGSSLHGQIMANFGGAKTELHGSIMGDKLDPNDFKMPGVEETQATSATAPQQQAAGGESKQLFSNAPIDLSALKSADATIDIAIGELNLGKATLKQVSGKVALANSDLTISPFKANLGDATMQGDVKLNATSSPAQYNVTFKAPGVDVATLLQMMGMDAFMSGKGDADIELSGSGNSPHEMAASANGQIIVTAAGGQISSAAAGGIAQGLAQIFAPGNGNPTLNCVATRFNVTNGIGKDNGMLADSSASTVAGAGGFNLGAETVDLTLNAKPKLVNTAGYLPAMTISGSLAAPKIGIDAAGTAQNVAGNLLKNNKVGGSLGSALGGVLGGGGNGSEATVPALATDVPQGQNACLYTLDHKPAAAAQQQAPAGGNNAVKDVTGQATGKAKDVGKQLMQGILGH